MARVRYSSTEVTDHAVLVPGDLSVEEIEAGILAEPDQLGCDLSLTPLELEVETEGAELMNPADSPLDVESISEADPDGDEDRELRVIRIRWKFLIHASVDSGTSLEAFGAALSWMPAFDGDGGDVDVLNSTCVSFSETLDCLDE